LATAALFFVAQPVSAQEGESAEALRANIQEDLNDISEALAKGNAALADGKIDEKLGKISDRIAKLKNTVVVLENGNAIVPAGKNPADVFKERLAAIQDAKDERQLIVEGIDGTFNEITMLRTGDPRLEAHAYVRRLVEQLSTELANDALAREEKAVASNDILALVPALHQALDEFEVSVTGKTDAPTLQQSAEALTRRLTAARGTAPLKEDDVVTALAALASELTRSSREVLEEAVKTDAASIKTASKNLFGALPDPDDSKAPATMLRNAILSDNGTGGTTDALTKLQVRLEKLLALEKPLVVRIHSARYRDAPWLANVPHRNCVATSYYRSQCDRKPGCTIATNYRTLSCGYDPAPAAKAKDRIIDIKYDCVPDYDAEFRGNQSIGRKSAKLRAGGAVICSKEPG